MPKISDEKQMKLVVQGLKELKEKINETIKLRRECGNLRADLAARNYFPCLEIIATMDELVVNNST